MIAAAWKTQGDQDEAKAHRCASLTESDDLRASHIAASFSVQNLRFHTGRVHM